MKKKSAGSIKFKSTCTRISILRGQISIKSYASYRDFTRNENRLAIIVLDFTFDFLFFFSIAIIRMLVVEIFNTPVQAAFN
jgi:hypothetical protein